MTFDEYIQWQHRNHNESFDLDDMRDCWDYAKTCQARRMARQMHNIIYSNMEEHHE